MNNDGTTCIKNKVISRICLERVVPFVGHVCICVAMSSADNLYKAFGPRSGPTERLRL